MAQNLPGFVPLPGGLVGLPGKVSAPVNPYGPGQLVPAQPPVEVGQTAWTRPRPATSPQKQPPAVIARPARPSPTRGDNKPPMATNTQSPTTDGTLTTSHSTGYSLFPAPKPAPVHLDSGIIPNVYASDVMSATENACSPLHVSCCKLYIPSSSDAGGADLYNYFKNVIAFDIQSKAQANVGFKLDISTILTTDNLRDALNDLLYALQIYFYYKGIMAFGYNPSNKNEAMTTLRMGITADDVLNLNELGMRLADTPIPPRMLELVRYMFSTFASGDSSGSPLLKICPLNASDTLLDSTAITTALSELNGATHTKNTELFALLRRSIKHWVNPNIMDPPDAPVYDPQFKTIFANLPFFYYNGVATNSKGPSVAGTTTEMEYNSYTNSLDGVAYAFTSYYDTTGGANFKPMLITPLAGTVGSAAVASRRSYYAVSGTKKFWPVQSYDYLKRSRQETYSADAAGTNYVYSHLTGAVKCKGVSIGSLTETAYKAFDYMLSVDTIKSTQQYPGLGTPSNSTGRSPRRRRTKK